ncbi:MAG: hypothetical protein IH602_13030 [Bryobacteraceae bacterium]|nr:hypothetical protein [Bryobacteraceae bacterium]
MPNSDDEDFAGLIQTGGPGHRRHANYFSTSDDRSDGELEVVLVLGGSLEQDGRGFYHSPKPRGKGEDPPDCEALSSDDEPIGFEVTELVEEASLKADHRGEPHLSPPCSTSALIDRIQGRIDKKDKPSEVKGGPYKQYVLVIHSDEPRVLDHELAKHLRAHTFGPTRLIDRVFFLMSYNGWKRRCPYIELTLRSRELVEGL